MLLALFHSILVIVLNNLMKFMINTSHWSQMRYKESLATFKISVPPKLWSFLSSCRLHH